MNETIKTANFNAEYDKLIKDIEETKNITKTAVLSRLRAFKINVITHEATKEITIPQFLEMR